MIESALADRTVLYFFRSDGCAACAAAEPELDRFMRRHPAFTVLTLDAGGPFPAQLGVKIKATPTYALRVGPEIARVEGALRATDIEKWLKKNGVSP